ncbi:MAG: 30S ribosomal protein S6 [Candidatus Omnitrophica bacterium]|nr:30S ribosomal protein S6 [Candidatus Omnitrophota bacterium]
MKSYEGTFIFPPDQSTDLQKTQVQQLEDLIKKFKGTIANKSEFGKKPLGYTIRKFREGYLVFLDFQMETSQAGEFRKALDLQESLMKYMITVKNIRPSKLPPLKTAPAAAPVASHPAPTSHERSFHGR